MAPNSHQTGPAPLHNQTAQRPEDHHLYTSLGQWHLPAHNPSPAAASSAIMLQHSEPPTQRQLPGFQHAASSEYVNIPPFQTVWQTPTFYRPGWSDALGDGNFASRPQIQYGEGEATTAVPHPDSAIARSYAPDRETPAHYVQYPDGFQASVQQHDFQQTSIEYAAPPPPNAPPFQADAQRSAPVAQLLNYPPPSTSAVHVHPVPLVTQTPMTWPGTSTNVAPVIHQDFSHALPQVTLAPGLVGAEADNLSAPSWNNRPMGEDAPVHGDYGRLPSIGPGWELVPPAAPGEYTHVPSTHQLPALPVSSPRHRSRSDSIKHKQPTTKVASSYIPRQTKVKVSKRKGPLNVNDRRKASNMRKHRVCVRCKMYKAGCDEGDPCQRCLKSFENARSFLEPCFRDHIQDTSLVRRCNGRCNQVEADFLKYSWQEQGSIFAMEIIWYLPGTSAPIRMSETLRIRCRGFYQDGVDPYMMKSMWKTTDGQVIELQQSPYAIFDTAALQADVDAYFCSNLGSMEQWIYQRICRDELALLTYNEAWRLRNNGLLGNDILDLTLRLQCLSIMSQGYGTVCTSNIPGIHEYDFRQLGPSEYEAYNRNSRDRPLPGAINHQMDVAFVKILKRLEKECHKALTQKVFQSAIKPWYELFLTFFVLYWNLEYIHQGADKYIQSKSGIKTQTHVGSVVRQQIKKWDDTFNIILRYWRTLLRTFVPFKVARENPEDLRDKGQLPDEEAFQYMMQVVAIFDRTGPDRHRPPLTGVPDSQFSMRSKWITALFEQGGA